MHVKWCSFPCRAPLLKNGSGIAILQSVGTAFVHHTLPKPLAATARGHHSRGYRTPFSGALMLIRHLKVQGIFRHPITVPSPGLPKACVRKLSGGLFQSARQVHGLGWLSNEFRGRRLCTGAAGVCASVLNPTGPTYPDMDMVGVSLRAASPI